MSRIQQVIDTLEAERDDLLERLAWIDGQIAEFRERHGDDHAPPSQRSARRATARRASTRRATARQRKDDVEGLIVEYLRDHPDSTTGDIAKSLNADRGAIAAGLSHIARASHVTERDLP